MQKHEKITNVFLQICCLSRDFSFSDIIQNQRIAKELFEKAGPAVTALFNQGASTVTKGTQFLTDVEFPTDLPIVCFLRNSCFISQLDFESEMKKVVRSEGNILRKLLCKGKRKTE